MEFTNIALSAVGIVCGILGWFARELYNATQSLRKDLSILEVQINRDYVRHDRLQEAFKPIMDTLKEIQHTLATKADK